MEKDKNRIHYLDNLCGLLIIDMVFFVHIRMHADVTSGLIPFINRLFCFFMPWFFYKSGMLYHEEDWKQRIRKDYKSLIVPYLYFTLFGWIIYSVSSIIAGKISIQHLVFSPVRELLFDEAIVWNGALWFLPSLFVVKWLACILLRRFNTAVIMTVAVALAAVFHYTGYEYPFYLGNIMLGLFFYSLGYLMRNIQFKTPIFILALALYITALIVPFISSYFDFRYNTVDEGDNYFLVLIYSIAGIITFNNLFKRLFDKDIPVISGIGRCSIIVLCVHYPLIKFITGVLVRVYAFNPLQLFGIISLMMIPLLWLFVVVINNKARFLIGK